VSLLFFVCEEIERQRILERKKGGIGEEKEKGRFLLYNRSGLEEGEEERAYTCMAHCLIHSS
jgi:hypothetical protein